MKIITLGTGHGSATATNMSSATYLQCGDKTYLVDCADGTDFAMMQKHLVPSAISAVFITHLHLDHTGGLPVMMKRMLKEEGVQVKRLHEYKRQLLNALNIVGLYLDLKENPDLDVYPQTYIFGAKAAAGYYMAKEIIRLLWHISKDIEQNPRIREKLRVVFLEDYNVSMAEALIPAAEISQQISLAGKEASGTGCMKFMMNGALTIGTLDGANVEMLAAAGEENMYIFGLTCNEVDELWLNGYNSALYCARNERLAKIVNYLNTGFAGQSFSSIASYLVSGSGVPDPYMCLADFESYSMTHKAMTDDYRDRRNWSRKSLINIGSSGFFAADRSIRDYAENIWGIKPVTLDSKK